MTRQPPRPTRHRLALLAALGCLRPGRALAVADSPQAGGEVELSLADLMNLTVEGVSKSKESFREVPMSVYVVSKDELERWGVRSFYDLFARVPGYGYYSTDQYGTSGPIGRGQKQIWKFGVSMEQMNMVDFGHYQLTPHFFKNVEVARGPAGLMWGTSAFGGLTNFNLRDDVHGMESYTEMGNYGRMSQDLLFGDQFKDADPGDGYFVGWRVQKQDPEIQKDVLKGMGQQSDDYKADGINPSQSLVGKLQYKGFKFILFKDHSAFVTPVMWMGKEWNGTKDRWLTDTLKAKLGEDFGDEMEVIATRAEYALPFQRFLGAGFPLNLALYHETYKKEWTFPGLVTDVQRKETFGVKGSAALLDNDLKLNFGGDIYGRNQTAAPSYNSTYATDSLSWHWYDNVGYKNWLYPEKRYHNAYLQASYKLRKDLEVLAGGRVDWVDSSTYGSMLSGPRLGVMWSPNESMTFKYLYNSSARPPEGNEESSVRNGGSLDPEKLTAHELVSMVTIGDVANVDLTLFYQKTEDAIVIDPTSKDSRYINVPGGTDMGVEWAVKALPFKDLVVSLNGSYNYAQVMKKTMVDTAGIAHVISEAHDSDDRPLFVPTGSLFLNLDYNLLGALHVSPSLRYVFDIPYQDGDGSFKTASGTFVDLTLRSRKFLGDRVDVSASVLNAFDFQDGMPAYGEHIGNPAGTIPASGRHWSATLHVAL